MYDEVEGLLKSLPSGVDILKSLHMDVQSIYVQKYVRATESIIFDQDVQMYVRVTTTVIFVQDYVTDHNFITAEIIGVVH